jgi:tyrosine decarboxylase/aspartate 1-decarboxylase
MARSALRAIHSPARFPSVAPLTTYPPTGLDATLLGSRSGAAAAACWAVVRAVGFDGFARRARHGMLLAQRLTEQLTNAPGVVALPGSGVNLVPLRLPADPAAAAAVRAVLARHHIHGERLPLAAGRCPIEVYPTYLMPHVRRADVDRFAAELAAACQGTCPSIANR